MRSNRNESSRPPRSYRQLIRHIFDLANRSSSHRAFVRESTKTLAGFAACHTVDLWLQFKGSPREGWRYSRVDDLLRPFDVVGRELDGVSSEGARLELRFGGEVEGELLLHAELSESKRDLYQDIATNLAVAIAYHRSQFSQRERVKELACLYQIASIAAQPDLTVNDLLQRVVAVLPPAWQFPKCCVARIEFGGAVHDTPNFDRAEDVQEAVIDVDGTRLGSVSVGYLESMPPQNEGPFLEEERRLLETVASEIAGIVERKRAEEERLTLRDQLQHADRLATIGQLAAGVAHELNEPLGSILGFAQLARKTPELAEQVAHDLDRIQTAALHSREIVKKLNLFARSGTEKPRRVNLDRVVRDGLVFLESRLTKEGISLELSLGSSSQDVVADPGQLTQVLMNLVVNAVQAMEPGGRLEIATRPGRDDDVVWTVADTGSGMSADVRARIFEPFYTTKDVGEGTGLGLAVVHGIVSAHGGTIRVESSEEGTMFEIHLPAVTDVE